MTENLGALTLGPGATQITGVAATSGGAGTTTISLASYNTRSVGSTLFFNPVSGSGTQIQFAANPPTLANGTIGGWAATGTDWPTVAGAGVNVAALATGSYTTTASLSTLSSGSQNVNLTGHSTPLSAALAINSLKLNNSTANNYIDLGGNTLTLASGGILTAQGQVTTIQSGTLTAGAAVGYALDQAFLNRIDPASSGVVALGANSANSLDMSAPPNVKTDSTRSGLPARTN